MTADIYNVETGVLITGGLQPSSVSSDAVRIAKEIADRRGEAVHLSDDDGDWFVYPDGTCYPLNLT